MLSERITALFHLLQCSNTDIARFAGCSPSNISRLKSGTREPIPGSRSILRLAEGVYRYADYENMLGVLGELCGTSDTQAETLIPAIAAWMYEESDYAPPHTVIPKSKREQEIRRHSFGERLDRTMTLLELSNAQLAAALNVDVSLVSRYRGGIYHPNRNERIKEKISELLLGRAEKLGRIAELSKLCAIGAEELSLEALTEWLCETEADRPSEMAEELFRSIDTFTPGQGIPSSPPEVPTILEAERYWGTEGLRSAVVRFLTDAAREGGELLLYSDEPMEWMSGSPEYFALWAALMVACVQNGVHIRIIHNIDRGGMEMVSAINGWFPLYMSGMIEPYIFRKERNARFHHTVFLRPGRAGILGSFPAESGETRWYDYITDKERLGAMEDGYSAMLSCASPFLRTYHLAMADEFRQFLHSQPEKYAAILDGFSFASMPEALLERILSRAELTAPRREQLRAFHSAGRAYFFDMLAHREVHEILCLPDRAEVARGGVKVSFGAELIDLSLHYTPEEYAEHAAAIRELVRTEKNYHLTLLPHAPFRDLQVFAMRESTAVLRCREPYTAFVFTNAMLTQSVSDYCASLTERYTTDRYTTMQALAATYS